MYGPLVFSPAKAGGFAAGESPRPTKILEFLASLASLYKEGKKVSGRGGNLPPAIYLLFMHQNLAVQGFHILYRQLGGVVAQSVDVHLFGKGGALRRRGGRRL